MKFLSFLGLFYVINEIFSIKASDSTTLPKPKCYTHLIKMKIRNSIFKRVVQSDYKTIKKHLFLMSDCMKEKISNTYEDFLDNYYQNVLHYYSMDEKDVFIIDNCVQLFL